MCNLFSPDPPPPPYSAGAATAQGAANRETAIAQGHINNPNVNNPYGNQTVTWDGEQPTITQTLSPDQQDLLNRRTMTQGLLANLAGQGAGSLQGLIGSQVDFGGVPQRPTALGYSNPNYAHGNPAGRPSGGPHITGGGVGSNPANANPIGRPGIMGGEAINGIGRPPSGTKFSTTGGNDYYNAPTPTMQPPTGGPDQYPDPNAPPTPTLAPQRPPGDSVAQQPPTQAPQKAAGSTSPNGTFLDDYRNQGSDYGGAASNFTGIDPKSGQQFINGHLFAAQGNTDSGDRSTPGVGFQNILNQYASQIAEITGQKPSTTPANPLPIPGGPPNTPPPGTPPPGTPETPPGGPAPEGTPGDQPQQAADSGIQLPQVQDIPRALNPNRLPQMGNPLDANGLPVVNSADQTRQSVINAMMGRSNIDLGQRQDKMNSDLIARGIRPGTEAYTREQDALERSRNDARQQAEIAGGNAAAQQFGLDLNRRQQAAGEQGQTFQQTSANRGQSAAEQGQSFGQSLSAGGQKFGQQGQVAQLQGQLQQQGFGQQNQSRRDAIAELLAQRQTPLNEISTLMGGSGVSNPFTVPGYNGNTSVAPPPIFGAATAQANANNNTYNAQTGTYNSMLGGLASLGGAGLGAFF